MITCCVTCAARAPSAWPPMPSTQTSVDAQRQDCAPGDVLPHAARRTVHMIASMTGFARREITGAWGTLVGELRARLTKQLRRGKVDCSLSHRRPQGADGALQIDAAALQRLLAAVHVVA